MKKCDRKVITGRMLFGRDCIVTFYNNTYHVIVDDLHYPEIVKGKELKGYKDDILYLQYTGERYDGDIILMSDLHGMVCKWKGEKI